VGDTAANDGDGATPRVTSGLFVWAARTAATGSRDNTPLRSCDCPGLRKSHKNSAPSRPPVATMSEERGCGAMALIDPRCPALPRKIATFCDVARSHARAVKSPDAV
jgi:hypothetical protein